MIALCPQSKTRLGLDLGVFCNLKSSWKSSLMQIWSMLMINFPKATLVYLMTASLQWLKLSTLRMVVHFLMSSWMFQTRLYVDCSSNNSMRSIYDRFITFWIQQLRYAKKAKAKVLFAERDRDSSFCFSEKQDCLIIFRSICLFQGCFIKI